MRLTKLESAPPYVAPLHDGVETLRLQGHEAGPTERFWVGLSYYEPGGTAAKAPAREETVYVVLDGELVLTVEDGEHTLRPLDSVHLSKGEVRSLENRSDRRATLLVVIAHPEGG